MLIKIGVVLVVLVVGFCIAASMQPEAFRYSRSAVLSAPAPALFAQVNDFHKWDVWSPWAKMDPNAKNTFEGPVSGVGAGFSWSGNSKVGAGRMTITESHPSDLIRMRLQFFKPIPGDNVTEFTFKPQGHQTLVTWTMSGKSNFMGKVMSLIINCDKMIGGQFETGLKNMEAAATKNKAPYAA